MFHRLALCFSLVAALAACDRRGDGNPARHASSAPPDPQFARSSIVSVAATPARGCPATQAFAELGSGTVHAAHIARNETWTAEGSPHRAPQGITIDPGASLTLTPCTRVLVGAPHAIVVADNAAIFAMGEAARPIRFGPDLVDALPGSWSGLRFAPLARPTSRLLYSTIEFGGAQGNEHDRACLVDAMPALDLLHVTFASCAGAAILVRRGGSFATVSSGITVDNGTPGSDAGGIVFEDPDASTTLPP